MNTCKTLLIMVFLTFYITLIKGQNHDHIQHNATLQQILPLLNHEEKVKLLDLAIQLSEQDLNQMLDEIYDKLSPTAQAKLLGYAHNLYTKNDRTTVQFSADELFFGKKIAGEPLVVHFHVTNTGTNPYLIKDIKTSAPDCITVNYPKGPIPPQQTGLIEVHYNSTGKYGRINQGIVIYDNSTPNLRNIIYVKGEISDNNPGVD